MKNELGQTKLLKTVIWNNYRAQNIDFEIIDIIFQKII